MNRFTKLVFVLCLALVISAVSHAAFAAPLDSQIVARLDALEKTRSELLVLRANAPGRYVLRVATKGHEARAVVVLGR